MKATYRINRISIGATVRVGAIVAAVFGLMIGIIWAFVALFFSAGMAAAFGGEMPRASALLVVFIPILVAVFYTFMGMVGSFLFALLYNIAAGIFGGIEVEMEDNRPEPQPESPRFNYV